MLLVKNKSQWFLSLAIAMGLWLLLSSQYRYKYGIIAIVLGCAWFAIALVDSSGGVLTTSDIAPHLTHRSLLGLTSVDLDYEELGKFKYILLNLRHPGWGSSLKITEALLTKLKQTSKFQLKFQQDDVFLFTRIP